MENRKEALRQALIDQTRPDGIIPIGGSNGPSRPLPDQAPQKRMHFGQCHRDRSLQMISTRRLTCASFRG